MPPVPSGVTPYPYQCAGVQYAAARKRVIIGDDMGLGKTLQAIMLCNQIAAQTVLVVCPASLRLNWLAEWTKFSTTVAGQKMIAVMSKTDLPEVKSADVVFISYDLMSSDEAQVLLRSRVWDVVIADEAHYLKNKESKRAIGLLGAPARSKKTAVKVPIQADRYVFLTGTPVSNRPADFWNLLRFCAPEHFGVWTAYALRYCDARQLPFGSGLDASGASNLDELQTLVRGSCMVRRLKVDVLTQLPAKTRKIVALPAPSKVIQEIDALTMQYKIADQTIADAKRKLAEAQTAGNAAEMQSAVASLKSAEAALFTETSKVRKAIGLAKVGLAVEHIASQLASCNDKIIIGAHHKEVVEQLVDAFKDHNPAVITGGVDPVKRQDEVVRFQTDPNCRVFIGNIIAAGTGLTLTAAPHVIIVEPDWVPANNAQFEDRAHRIGQSKPVVIEYLAMEGTIDVQVLKAVARKMDVIEKATDNQTGLRLEEDTVNTTVKSPAVPSKPVSESIAEESAVKHKRMQTMALGRSLSPRDLIVAHNVVRHVARHDSDRARAVNGVGFNKLDTEFGTALAAKSTQSLNDFEKGRVVQLAWKYRTQATPELAGQLRDPKQQTQEQEQ